MPKQVQINKLLANIIEEDKEEQSDDKALPLETPEPPVDSDASGPSGYLAARGGCRVVFVIVINNTIR